MCDTRPLPLYAKGAGTETRESVCVCVSSFGLNGLQFDLLSLLWK